MDRLGSKIDRVRPVLAAVAAAIALAATAGATRQTPAPAPAAAADGERLRLAGLRRDATTLLTRAARPDTAADARRAALRDAADRLRALGAEPAGGRSRARLRGLPASTPICAPRCAAPRTP